MNLNTEIDLFETWRKIFSPTVICDFLTYM